MDLNEPLGPAFQNDPTPTLRAGQSPGPADVAGARSRMSLFLDVDGTLVDFAARPDAIRISTRLSAALLSINLALDGAMAIVSGRSIDDLTRLFDKVPILLIGHHGASWRAPLPGAYAESLSVALPPDLRAQVVALATALGAWVEDKRLCMAVHHPDDAEVQARLIAGMSAAAGPHWAVMTGRRVVEIKPKGIDKGSACRRLLGQAPFVGTVPVAFGDDITDLDMFQVIDACQGISVGVGDRVAGAARYHVDGPAEVIRALEWIAANIGRDAPAELVRCAVASLGAR